MNTCSNTKLASSTPPFPFPAGQTNNVRQYPPADETPSHQLPLPDTGDAQTAFNDLLSWLGPDSEAAGHAYELIRRRLIFLFRCRGCAFSEDLADETINRVTRKLPQIKSSYKGNPAFYFYGVGKKIYKEYLRSLVAPSLPPVLPFKEDREELLQHLDEALSKLKQGDRELILNYYSGEGQSKIAHRKAMADQMGVGANALRLRIYRIREQLKTLLNP